MPKLLAAKQYPALVDVYNHEWREWAGEIYSYWNYDDPTVYRCNFMSLKGHSLQFGEAYASSDRVKIEVDPRDAEFIQIGMRFGNLRMKNDQSQQYYKYVGRLIPDIAVDYYFDIDAMNPQIDNNGRVVCVEIYGQLAA